MDVLQVIETLGVPIAVSLGLGYALMYLIKFLTKDIKSDIKNLYDITVKLIDASRQSRDDARKTLTATKTMKEIFIKIFNGINKRKD
jgi:hypothetical protein